MSGGSGSLANNALITIDAEISINITASNYFLEYCLMYIPFMRQYWNIPIFGSSVTALILL